MNSHEQSVQQVANSAPRKHPARSTLIRIVELALLAIGLICAGIFVAARLEGYFASRAAIEEFESVPEVADGARVANVQGSAGDEPDFSEWGEGRIRAYAGAAQQRHGTALAVLEIPRLHLKAPVFDGTDELTLNHAVGLIAGTAWPGEEGNIGIAGHRDGFFRKLKNIRVGDQIELETRAGTDLYSADKIQIVTPRDVSVLQSDGGCSLTLVTCYPFYSIGSAPKRFVVKAHLISRNPARIAASASRLNHQTPNP